LASQYERFSSQEPHPVDQEPIRVLLGLDTPMDCQLLKTAANGSGQRFNVVASAVSKDGILDSFSRSDVDVALINVDLEDGRLAGLEILPELCATYRTPVVVLFDRWQDDLIVHAFRGGAKGVFCRLEKELELLWKCISAVHNGHVWASSEQLQLLLSALQSEVMIPRVPSPGMKSLAARETQVANLVAEGLPNKNVAAKLGLSEHTVSNYLFRIYNKLGISSRIELALYVLKEQEPHNASPLAPSRKKTAGIRDGGEAGEMSRKSPSPEKRDYW
jgi:two-component system, NarL family, nitrate/nitrite response regulator NarL